MTTEMATMRIIGWKYSRKLKVAMQYIKETRAYGKFGDILTWLIILVMGIIKCVILFVIIPIFIFIIVLWLSGGFFEGAVAAAIFAFIYIVAHVFGE